MRQREGNRKGIRAALALALLLAVLRPAAGLAGRFRPLPVDLSPGAPLQAEFNYDIPVYEDPTIRVEHHRVDHSEWGVIYYYALVTVRDPSQIRTASADDTFVSYARDTANNIARRKNAALAINGDFTIRFTKDEEFRYVYRQGQLYRDVVEPYLDLLLIDEDGDFHILTDADHPAEIDKTVIDGKKVINAFQFGPALVVDGEKVPDERLLDYKYSPRNALPDRRAQRMCIAQTGDLSYMVLCCRQGLPLTALRDLVLSISPCRVAYTLDGGNSAQLVFMGTKINNVKKGGELRRITDIIYFASAWFTEAGDAELEHN